MNLFREPEGEYSLADIAKLKEENGRKITITKVWVDEYWTLYDHYMDKYQPPPPPPQVCLNSSKSHTLTHREREREREREMERWRN
jgi:hypothetical protein